jgi:hypothetical protein
MRRSPPGGRLARPPPLLAVVVANPGGLQRGPAGVAMFGGGGSNERMALEMVGDARKGRIAEPTIRFAILGPSEMRGAQYPQHEQRRIHRPTVDRPSGAGRRSRSGAPKWLVDPILGCSLPLPQTKQTSRVLHNVGMAGISDVLSTSDRGRLRMIEWSSTIPKLMDD